MASRLRIIQVVNVRWFNATAWYGIELARLLALAGHDSLVLGLAHTESFARARALGLNLEALPLNAKNPLLLPGLTADMARLVRRFKPDVVNGHRGEAFVLWGALKAAMPFALVRTRGDQRLPRNNVVNRWLHTRAADAVVATNTAMARHFREVLHVPAGRVHTILGGVDTARFAFNPAARAAVRAACGYTDEHCVLGLLGRFDMVKGQRETLAAVARLVAEGLDHVRLLLLGFATATSRETVEGWIREYGLERHARISGRVEDVPAHLAALDVGLVASLGSEAIARAALEIMACARPLVSTRVGVMPDLLPAEALVPPGDVTALAAVLRRAVLDAPWRAALARTCVSRIADGAGALGALTSEAFLNASLRMYDDALRVRRDAPSLL